MKIDTIMDVLEAVKNRIELRSFSDEPIDANDKEKILNSGRLAPSGRNIQHWRFILIDTEDELARLAELCPTGSWVAGAGFAVVVCTDPSHTFHHIDAGRAITHMQLTAWDLGIGSCIYTEDNPELREFLEVPDNYDITLISGFGYPESEIQGIKNRKPLEDIAFSGSFDTTLDLEE